MTYADGTKKIKAGDLRGILLHLDVDNWLECNRVGNLCVRRNDEYLGYIDFGTGRLELLEADEETEL